MFAAATSFCDLPRYCTLLFSWKTHTIKLCPLPEGTSKNNCYKGDVFVCNVLWEILHQFQQNCRILRSSSSKPTTTQKATTAPTRREKQALLWLLRDTGVSADCAKSLLVAHQDSPFWREYDVHTIHSVKKHLFLFDGKEFRNLLNKKVTLRVYRIQEMENTSRLTPLSRGSSLNCLLCWYGFTFHRKRWYSVCRLTLGPAWYKLKAVWCCLHF